MFLLALDCSTKSTGWCIYDDKKLIKYGCITSSSTDKIKRIYKMIEGLREILSENKIDKIVLEEVRPDGGNPQTYKALMYLQAAIAFFIHDEYSNIEIEFIYPSSWRACCGIKNGRGIKREELKKADIEFVKNKYNITVNDDIADAIGIGYSQTFKKEDKGYAW